MTPVSAGQASVPGLSCVMRLSPEPELTLGPGQAITPGARGHSRAHGHWRLPPVHSPRPGQAQVHNNEYHSQEPGVSSSCTSDTRL